MSPIHYRVRKPGLCPQLPGAMRVGSDEFVVSNDLIPQIEILDVHGVIEVVEWGDLDG